MESLKCRRAAVGPVCRVLIFWLAMIIPSVAFGAASGHCCDNEWEFTPIWIGTDPVMTFEQIASYCAPILWFSPDEPNLEKTEGKDIRIPSAFPFQEQPEAPVVYYRVRTLLVRADTDDEVFRQEDPARVETVVDLRQVGGIDLDYFFYYPSEEGLGAHKHDVEATFLKVYVSRCLNCTDEQHYALFVERTIAKAHGIQWYDNTLVTDRYAHFPMTLLVEEGKHASCTDKNSDGIYTPTFDVNRRINDAWGIRDIMRSGGLYAGGFQAWMAKTRRPEHRVFPPLPADSPLRDDYTENGVYAADNAIYEVRPFPRSEEVVDDPKLVPFIADKGSEDWPEIVPDTDLHKFGRWLDEERFINSLSIAYRYDGLNHGSRDHTGGISFIFPLLVVKNISDPIGGGWFVNRLYFKDKKLRDISWNILYTTSASRWVDGYFTFGWEWDRDDESNLHTDMMTETGIKFRLNMSHTPLKFLGALGTDFWGVRIGIKNKGIFNWDAIGYALEVGAGVW